MNIFQQRRVQRHRRSLINAPMMLQWGVHLIPPNLPSRKLQLTCPRASSPRIDPSISIETSIRWSIPTRCIPTSSMPRIGSHLPCTGSTSPSPIHKTPKPSPRWQNGHRTHPHPHTFAFTFCTPHSSIISFTSRRSTPSSRILPSAPLGMHEQTQRTYLACQISTHTR